MDALILSRIQFAANISFHILFPAITIALGWFLLFFKLRYNSTQNYKWMNINAGTSISKNRNAKAMGFSLNYRRWKINYGIYFHETAVLGIPQFLDVRLYL